MWREEELTHRVLSLEGLAGVADCIFLPCCRNSSHGEWRRRHILPTSPDQHFRINGIGFLRLTHIREARGGEGQCPPVSPGYRQGRFARCYRFLELSAKMQSALVNYTRQIGLRVQLDGTSRDLYAFYVPPRSTRWSSRRWRAHSRKVGRISKPAWLGPRPPPSALQTIAGKTRHTSRAPGCTSD
jgi:hypothetical protein